MNPTAANVLQDPFKPLQIPFRCFRLVGINPSFGSAATKMNDPRIAVNIDENIIRFGILPGIASPMQGSKRLLDLPRPPVLEGIRGFGLHGERELSVFLDGIQEQADQLVPLVSNHSVET